MIVCIHIILGGESRQNSFKDDKDLHLVRSHHKLMESNQ